MQSAFEERTAPPVTQAFLKAAGSEVSAKAMEDGRRLYTNRCTECHDLELLDSRSVNAWRDVVGTMARRAKIDGGQQARIVEYLAAAQRGLDAGL
jgi:mono/diheme cytochrome c family protein